MVVLEYKAELVLVACFPVLRFICPVTRAVEVVLLMLCCGSVVGVDLA